MPDSRVLIRLCSVAGGSLLMLAAHAPSDVWARGGGGGGGHGGGGHSGHSTGSVNPSSHYTRGYYRQDGAYVQPHYQTNPNHTVTDNYSFEGNINPHNGKMGTNRYPHDSTSSYYTGPDSHGKIGHANENANLDAPCVWNGTMNCAPLPLYRD